MYETKQQLIDEYSKRWKVEHVENNFYLIQGRYCVITKIEGKFKFDALE